MSEGMSAEAIEAKMQEIIAAGGVLFCPTCRRRFEPRIETFYAHVIRLRGYNFCSDPPAAAFEEVDGVWKLKG